MSKSHVFIDDAMPCRTGKNAVFAEGWIHNFTGRNKRFVSWILNVEQGMTTLAYAVRNPDDSPNRKLAKKICIERLKSGNVTKLSSTTVVERMAWIECGGIGNVPVSAYNLGWNGDGFLINLPPLAFASCIEAFLLDGLKNPQYQQKSGTQSVRARSWHCMDVIDAIMDNEASRLRMI